jgi:hypothetical protein
MGGRPLPGATGRRRALTVRSAVVKDQVTKAAVITGVVRSIEGQWHSIGPMRLIHEGD